MRVFGSLRTPPAELDHLLAASRRFDVLQDMTRRMRAEMLPDRVMEAGLQALSVAMGSDGAAIVNQDAAPLFQTDALPAPVLATIGPTLTRDSPGSLQTTDVPDHVSLPNRQLLW